MIGLHYIMDIEDMTPIALAGKLHVSPSLVYRWINGKKPLPKQRTIQIHSKVFPEYPEEYYDKELNEADMTLLRNIRTSKTGTIDHKTRKMIEYGLNYADEVGATLERFNQLLSVSANTQLLNQSMNMNVYLMVMATMFSEQATTLSDLKALYDLETIKGQRTANILVSITLSALCEVLGIGGYINNVVCPRPLRIVLGDNMKETGTFDKEIHDQLKAVFTEIVDRYDKRDKILEALNNKLKNNEE